MKTTIYEFIAFPAHCWLWLCAKLLGWSFSCGPVDEDEDIIGPYEGD